MDREIFARIQNDPLFFIGIMWKLKPQKILKEYESLMEEAREKQDYSGLRRWMFEPYIKGQHITWQQAEIVESVRRGINGISKKLISIRSGHGIGKSTIIAMLIIWYLFSRKDAKVPCTAPTANQMYDVLWAEIKKWIIKMPEAIAEKYEHTSEYVRIKENPENWFARARTAKKEDPEALAGLHADHMLLVVDEASWVPDEVFDASASGLTGDDVLMIMISNPTRLLGHFFDSHHKLKKDHQVLNFSCIESPIVDHQFVQRIIDKNWEGSDEYRIRVLGEFGEVDSVDEKGYVQILQTINVVRTRDTFFDISAVLGIDPAWDGDDLSAWVLRDRYKARIVSREIQSTPESVAQRTLTIMSEYNIPPERVVVDNFGVGANVAQELALSWLRINAINVGQKPLDTEWLYINLRAELYTKLQKWIAWGGLLSEHEEWSELDAIRYRRELSNRLKIMGKDEMRKNGIKSPNFADALMLTFYVTDQVVQKNTMWIYEYDISWLL